MEWKKKTAQTRQAWLDELGRRLVWYFPANQVKDILSDYREQFDAGHEHCKTESEMIQGLGTPAEAAALLVEEEPSAKLGCLRHSILWGAALAVCCFFLWVCLSTVSYGLFWIGVVFFIPFAASMLFRLVRGPARVALAEYIPSEKRASPALVYCLPAALTLVCLAERVLLWLYSGHLVSRHQANQITEEAFERTGSVIRNGNVLFLLGLLILLALLLAGMVFLCVKASIGYFPGVIHIFGTLGTVYFTLTYYSAMNLETWGPVLDTLFSLLPYGVGLATALAFQRWIDGRRPLPRIFQGSAVSWQDWRHRLGVCLLRWFPVEQTLEILEDYQEQFDLGREMGKSEETILSEMGRPETVVRDLLAEDRKARLRRRKTWGWAVLAGVSGWLLAGLLRCFEFGYAGFRWFYGQNAFQTSLFALLLGTVSLFFLLRVRERTVLEQKFPAPKKPPVWLLLPPIAASALVESLVLYLIYNALDYRMPVFLGKPVTWYIILSIEFSAMALALLLIWTLNRCVSGSIRHFPALPPIAGGFSNVLCAGIYLKSMDMDSLYYRETVGANLTAVYPLLAGLVLGIVLWLILRANRKKEG